MGLRQRLIFALGAQVEDRIDAGIVTPDQLADAGLAEFISWLYDEAKRYSETGHHPQTAQVFGAMAALVDHERGA